ncbi:MAG TPA: hypothetical protein VF072_07630 [Thermoleophilaceae bacterium]
MTRLSACVTLTPHMGSRRRANRCSLLYGVLGVTLLALSGTAVAAVGDTLLVSRNGFGAKGNFASDPPTLSGDGRFVAFASSANNLHPDDPAGRFTLGLSIIGADGQRATDAGRLTVKKRR